MARRLRPTLLAMALGVMPLATSATCNPRTGTFFFDRYDDHRDVGFFDFFVDDYGCCYDDYYYEEVVFIDEYY